MAPPPSSPVARPPAATLVAPPKATIASPPPVAAPKKEAKIRDLVGDEMIGVVVGRTYDATSNKVLFGRVLGEDGNYYTAHSKECTVPEEGVAVIFAPYKFEARNGHAQAAAKIVESVGTDSLIKARMEFVRQQGKYRIMPMESFLATSGDGIEDPNIVGMTTTGMVVYYIKG